MLLRTRVSRVKILTTGKSESQRGANVVRRAIRLMPDMINKPTQQGVPTKNHRVQKELERVKGYMTKLQVIKAPSTPGGGGAAAAANKPALKVDTAASQRMVVSAVRFRSRCGDLSLLCCLFVDVYLHDTMHTTRRRRSRPTTTARRGRRRGREGREPMRVRAARRRAKRMAVALAVSAAAPRQRRPHQEEYLAARSGSARNEQRRRGQCVCVYM